MRRQATYRVYQRLNDVITSRLVLLSIREKTHLKTTPVNCAEIHDPKSSTTTSLSVCVWIIFPSSSIPFMRCEIVNVCPPTVYIYWLFYLPYLNQNFQPSLEDDFGLRPWLLADTALRRTTYMQLQHSVQHHFTSLLMCCDDSHAPASWLTANGMVTLAPASENNL